MVRIFKERTAATSSGAFLHADDLYFNHRHIDVMIVVFAPDLEDRLHDIVRTVAFEIWKVLVLPDLFGSAATKNVHGTFNVIPFAVCIEAQLQPMAVVGQICSAMPVFQRLKEPFDFAVELLRPVANAFLDADAKVAKGLHKAVSELRVTEPIN